VNIQQAFERALRHHQSGRLAEAEAIYRQILATEPHHADALHFLGAIAHQAGRNDVAVELIRKAVALKPNYPQAHYHLGIALREQGQLDEAVAAYRQAVTLQFNFVEAYSNLGIALREKGQIGEAIAACRQAIALNANYAEAHNNLGVALKDLGQLTEAVSAYRKAVALKPNSPEVHCNLGIALREQGKLDEAVAAYRHAIRLQPDFAEAHHKLGIALSDKGQLDEAIAAYRQAIALKPDHFEAHGNLGNCYKDTGRLDEAIAAYRRASELQPHVAGAYSNLVYTLHFHPAYDRDSIHQEQLQWARQFAEPLQKVSKLHDNDRNVDRRLRIGYVSPNFCHHVVGLNVFPLFQHHNRQTFEIVCYSDCLRQDSMTARLRSLVTEWCDTGGLSDEQLGARIHEDRIDILIDLTLHMAGNRLPVFARKPAPVQVTFAGYPGTTGLKAIDYRLTDPYLDPPGLNEAFYSEESFRLESFWCFAPDDHSPPVSALPALENGILSFGCLNTFCKVNDRVIELWSRVLNSVTGARLLMLSPLGEHRKRTLRHFESLGIARERVDFVSRLPRPEYLALHHRLDIILDTFPYNGHSTTLDALWMGVPVVSLARQMAVSRGGLSILSNVGLPEMVAHTDDEYVRIATELAGDIPRLADLRAKLRMKMQASVLTDAPRFARTIEAAYCTMWRRWCAEKNPPQP